MALNLRRIWPMTRCWVCQIALPNKAPVSVSRRRPFSSTARPRRRNDEDEEEEVGAEEVNRRSMFTTTVVPNQFLAQLSPHDRAFYNSLSVEEKEEFQQDMKDFVEGLDSPKIQAEINAAVDAAASEVESGLPMPPNVRERPPGGFMAMGEPDPFGTGEDDEFMGDDLTSTGHGELDMQREMREYARIAAWEMPLLSSKFPSRRLIQCDVQTGTSTDCGSPELAKPFELPAKDQSLRFRYTTYLGEQHPAERKVVVEFCTEDLPDLTEVQRRKFIKLVGVRYNPDTDIVKMSCEMFEAQAQNKRYLGDLINTLLKEARVSPSIQPLQFA